MINRVCEFCGKSFKVNLYTVKRGGGLFCSNSCRAKVRQKGSGNSKYKGKILIKCEICEKEFSVSPSKGHSRFCSIKCAGKFKVGRYIKEKSGIWKGGSTSLSQFIRSSNRYQIWRQEIFLRDDFTCLYCGKRGGSIHAHHIKTVSILMEEIRKNLPLFDSKEAALIYGPLWDISNGKTLCEPCHRNIHGKGGEDGKRS